MVVTKAILGYEQTVKALCKNVCSDDMAWTLVFTGILSTLIDEDSENVANNFKASRERMLRTQAKVFGLEIGDKLNVSELKKQNADFAIVARKIETRSSRIAKVAEKLPSIFEAWVLALTLKAAEQRKAYLEAGSFFTASRKLDDINKTAKEGTSGKPTVEDKTVAGKVKKTAETLAKGADKAERRDIARAMIAEGVAMAMEHKIRPTKQLRQDVESWLAVEA
jgi:hypothetical protein